MPEAPHRRKARLLGAIYVLYFITAVAGGLLVKGLAIPGDPVATAHNFAAHATAARAASAIGLVSLALYLALTALFYELFRPVSRRLSLLTTLFSVTACALQAAADVFLAPMQVLAATPAAYGAEALRPLALASLAMHAQALQSALVLFGGFDILIGILIVRSRLVPRPFGLLMALAGLGWLVYLWPPLANKLANVVQPLGFLAEAVLMIWLLARGVDEERWHLLAIPSS